MAFRFVVGDATTGVIRRYGHCSDQGDVSLQAGPGEIVIEVDGDHSDLEHRIDLSTTPPIVVPI